MPVIRMSSATSAPSSGTVAERVPEHVFEGVGVVTVRGVLGLASDARGVLQVPRDGLGDGGAGVERAA